MEATTSVRMSSSSMPVRGMTMSLRAKMAGSVRVAAASSPTTQEFLAKNGLEEEEKEEGGNKKIEGFVTG